MYRALLFDLYDTVVLFQRHVPRLNVPGAQWRSTMGWLRDTVATELPGVSMEDFVAAITATTIEIRARPPDYFELPSRERFRRTLVRLGVAEDAAVTKAQRLSQVHMRHLADLTELPAEHGDLLRRLRRRYPLGLVSNFDHAPTARAILARDGLAELFRSVVISDEFGRRKPHPAIFNQALQQLAVAPAEAIFIGDSVIDDVGGASAVGMDTIWINPHDTALPDGSARPTHTVQRLIDIEALIER